SRKQQLVLSFGRGKLHFLGRLGCEAVVVELWQNSRIMGAGWRRRTKPLWAGPYLFYRAGKFGWPAINADQWQYDSKRVAPVHLDNDRGRPGNTGVAQPAWRRHYAVPKSHHGRYRAGLRAEHVGLQQREPECWGNA